MGGVWLIPPPKEAMAWGIHGPRRTLVTSRRCHARWSSSPEIHCSRHEATSSGKKPTDLETLSNVCRGTHVNVYPGRRVPNSKFTHSPVGTPHSGVGTPQWGGSPLGSVHSPVGSPHQGVSIRKCTFPSGDSLLRTVHSPQGSPHYTPQ
jgi:hypothetical protein